MQPDLDPDEIRTSESDPIFVAWLPLPGRGGVGLTIAPGKHQRSLSGSPWERTLAADLDQLVSHDGATMLVCLLEDKELVSLQIPALVAEAEARSLEVLRFAIRDGDVPKESELPTLKELVANIQRAYAAGGKVVIHCAGGLGRSGLVAGCVIMANGHSADEALEMLRAHRGKSCPETHAQKRYLREHEPAFRAV